MGEYSYKAEQSSRQGQDRVGVFEVDDCIILLLADGAGGRIGAEHISDKYIDLLKDSIKNNPATKDSLILEQIMRDIDIKLSQDAEGCESTAIVCIINRSMVWGASIGDSKCWMFNNEYDYELTNNQYRKPLLGSGQAIPVGFGPFDINGFIVIGSDGLFNYTSIDVIKDTVKTVTIHKASESLINLVRLPSGGLQDDCSVIVYKA